MACHEWTLEKTVETCLKYSIEALEIRMGLHPWSQLDLPDEDYQQMYQRLEQEGLCVSDLGTGIVIDGENADALKELERCAQIAKLLHCKGLRIMLGHFYTRHSEPRKVIDEHGLLSWLKKADALMEQYHTQVWIETHNEYASGKALRELLGKEKLPNVKLLWDIMHPIEAGETPRDTLAYMQEDLVHVHIKDGRPWQDADMENYQYTNIGEGVIPIRQIVEMLLAADYQGYFSLEWEGVWRPEIQTEGYSSEKAIRDFADMMASIGV